MVRILRCLLLLSFWATPSLAQWSMTGSLGYSRAINGSGLDGGATYSVGFVRTGPGPHFGIEVGKFHLGRDHSFFRRPGGLFPGDVPSIVITDNSQRGWRLAATLDMLTISRVSWIGSAGLYRFTGEYGSEIRDSTGQQILRPRSALGGTTTGAGLMTGIRFDLFSIAQDFGVSLEAAGHAIGLRSSGEEAGYSFLHYFSFAARVRLRI